MPQHPYYEPTNEFIERHGLHISEAETWAELTDALDSPTRSLHYNKETGAIILFEGEKGYINYHEDCVFHGFLPDEAALESVIQWTSWGLAETR